MLVAIDAHVHLYDCFDLGRFFSSATANFSAQTSMLEGGNSSALMLCLTERRRDTWFLRLREYAGLESGVVKQMIGDWDILETAESSSLAMKRDDGKLLLLIGGKQIVTKENLEVLALGTVSTFPDGHSLSATLDAVRQDGAIPVIPWGFGKWFGKRGHILRKQIEAGKENPFFLGDNGGRPSILPYPAYFRLAEANGIRVLPGSDPLPFPSESTKPGSYGFTVTGTIDYTKPAEDMKKILLDPTTRPAPYGKPERFFRFIRNQCVMQTRKINSQERR